MGFGAVAPPTRRATLHRRDAGATRTRDAGATRGGGQGAGRGCGLPARGRSKVRPTLYAVCARRDSRTSILGEATCFPLRFVALRDFAFSFGDVAPPFVGGAPRHPQGVTLPRNAKRSRSVTLTRLQVQSDGVMGTPAEPSGNLSKSRGGVKPFSSLFSLFFLPFTASNPPSVGLTQLPAGEGT